LQKGNVQKSGYRDYVQERARELNIKGFVENLRDGNVKIVCGREEEKIKENQIKIKKGFIDVKEISVTFEEPKNELMDQKYGKYQKIPKN